MRYPALTFCLAACGSDPASPSPSPDVLTVDATPDADLSDTATSDAPAEAATSDASAPEAAVDVALEAATDAPADAADATPTCVDRDGDGYGTGCARGPDCDDTDAQRHPGATERCNGLDDDCDGTGDVARSDALDAWCTTLWRTQYARRNFNPMEDLARCHIPPAMPRPSEPSCHPTRVACAAVGYNPSTACLCFTSADENFACP